MTDYAYVKSALFYLLVLVIVVFSVFPFYYAIVTSFSTGSALFEVHFWPAAWDFSNYVTVLSKPAFSRSIANSRFGWPITRNKPRSATPEMVRMMATIFSPVASSVFRSSP